MILSSLLLSLGCSKGSLILQDYEQGSTDTAEELTSGDTGSGGIDDSGDSPGDSAPPDGDSGGGQEDSGEGGGEDTGNVPEPEPDPEYDGDWRSVVSFVLPELGEDEYSGEGMMTFSGDMVTGQSTVDTYLGEVEVSFAGELDGESVEGTLTMFQDLGWFGSLEGEAETMGFIDGDELLLSFDVVIDLDWLGELQVEGEWMAMAP